MDAQRLEFLRRIREHEAARFVSRLAPRSRVLEIGGGTGWQAAILARAGFEVRSVDLPESVYASERVFEIIDYDGRHLPFPDASFDAVVSSNVLEHVVDLPGLLGDIRRVLAPGGECLHALPTPAWRAWTTIAGWAEAVPLAGAELAGALPRGLGRYELVRPINALAAAARIVRARAAPGPHGESSSAFAELWTFHPRTWQRVFRANGFDVLDTTPIGLFYTGHSVLGRRWSIASRERWARRLGSACVMYRIRPS